MMGISLLELQIVVGIVGNNVSDFGNFTSDMCSVTVPLDSSEQGQGQQSILPCVGKVCGDRYDMGITLIQLYLLIHSCPTIN